MDAVWKAEVDKRLNEIEKKQAVQETRIDTIEQSIKVIKDNTTWTFRLVAGALVTSAIGAVVTAVIMFLLKGGALV